jgi:hypothetical protein
VNRVCTTALYFLLSASCAAPLIDNSQAQGIGQRTFSSRDDAVTSLIQALREGKPSEIEAVLGPGSEQIVSSGDSVADRAARESFLTGYDERHLLVPSSQGNYTLEVGKVGWPLPIPLAHAGASWYWDGKAGKEEILYRRIGHNELAAINVCQGIVAAQHDYAASAHDRVPKGAYAARIVSEPGKQNGLYWQVNEGQQESPAGPLLAHAAQEGYDISGKRTPYHGYYYRMLPSKDGFGVVAFPADYRSSGVMTFIVNQNGRVFQKDLGQDTATLAEKMTSFHPDKTWEEAK